MTNIPITVFVALGLLATACTESSGAKQQAQAPLSAIRIEIGPVPFSSIAETFVIRENGSGCYQRSKVEYAGDEQKENIEVRNEFGANSIEFARIANDVDYLRAYSSNDGMYGLANTFRDYPKLTAQLKKSIRCGVAATDNGRISVWWNDVPANQENFKQFFSIYGGCRSKEAQAALQKLRAAMNAVRRVAPESNW